MGRRLRVGVIGVGAMGRNHARICAELTGVELAGVNDADYRMAQSVAGKYRSKPFADYKVLLINGLDVVSITVSTSLHHEVALEEPVLCVDTSRVGMVSLADEQIAQGKEDLEHQDFIKDRSMVN